MAWGQYGKFYVIIRQEFQSFHIDCGFRQPNAFRLSFKAQLKIFNAPNDLGKFIFVVGKGHNDMVVDLRYCAAVPAEMLFALFVGLQNGLISFRVVFLQPGKQRRAEVKTYFGVIVYDVFYLPFTVKNSGESVGVIALRRYAFIPIVERPCAFLYFYFVYPGVFARRLVKMSVNTKISVHL